MNLKGSVTSIKDLSEELADVIICVDLIAMDLDINLPQEIAKKFNKTSEEHGFNTKM